MKVSVFHVQLFLVVILSLFSVSSGGRIFHRIREYFRSLTSTTSSPYIRYTTSRYTAPSTTTPSWSITDRRMRFTNPSTSPSPPSQIMKTKSPESVSPSVNVTTPKESIKESNSVELDCWWTPCHGNCPGTALIKGSRTCESKKLQFNCCIEQMVKTKSQTQKFSEESSSPESVSANVTTPKHLNNSVELDCWWTPCHGNCPGPALIKGSRTCESGKLQFNCCIGQ